MEEYKGPEQKKVDQDAPPHGLLGNDLVNHLKRLKEKCRTHGEERPAPRDILALAFWILLIGWWVLSFLILTLKARGCFMEGQAGFVMMLIYRFGFSSFGVFFLVWYRRKYVSHGRSWGWWIGAVCLAVVLFLVLRNPIRDIPVLSHPETAVLQNWETRWDASGEYSSFFQVVGDTEGGQHMTFYINKSSYERLPDSDRATKVTVEYLPHTKAVLSIRLQKVEMLKLSGASSDVIVRKNGNPPQKYRRNWRLQPLVARN